MRAYSFCPVNREKKLSERSEQGERSEAKVGVDAKFGYSGDEKIAPAANIQ